MNSIAEGLFFTRLSCTSTMGNSKQGEIVESLLGLSLGSIELFAGEKAYRLLEDASFCSEWDDLLARCPWGTVFQGRKFVGAWCNAWRGAIEPVAVVARGASGLTGLLWLSRVNGAKLMTGAGDTAAGYHVWLSEPELGELFATAALKLVLKQFPKCTIVFKHIPPPTPLSWTESDPVWRRRCVVKALPRPLMDLTTSELLENFNKKTSRRKINKIKQLGDFRFERVTELSRFVEVLDVLNEQFDFRKASMLNITPFRSEPQKRAVQLALFKQGLLYVTLLTVNGELVASNIDTIGSNNWVFGVGINTHAPTYGRYSPGIVSFMLLGQRLYEEGVQFYDLTTGGHSYKERLVNARDEVYELSIGGKRHHIKYKLAESVLWPVKQLLRRYGYKPSDFRMEWYRVRERLKVVAAAGVGECIIRTKQLVNKPIEQTYVIEKATADAQVTVKENNLSDLLCFDQQGGILTRWDFIQDAEQRLQAGESAYTFATKGRLNCCAWLSKSTGNVSPNAVVLSGVYCHRSELKSLVSFIAAIIAKVGSPVYLVTDDPKYCRVLEIAGLKPMKNNKLRLRSDSNDRVRADQHQS